MCVEDNKHDFEKAREGSHIYAFSHLKRWNHQPDLLGQSSKGVRLASLKSIDQSENSQKKKKKKCSGRRGKKELMRQMKTTGIPQLDPEEHDSNAEASVDAHQAEDIQLMRRLSVKPRNSLRNSQGAILKAVEKEGAEAEAPALGSQV